MVFQTKVPVQPGAPPLTYESSVFLLGSCFAANIAEKFSYFGFQSLVNPHGIIFNPKSLERFLNRVASQQPFDEQDIFSHNGQFICFDAHSDISSADPQLTIAKLNETALHTHAFLKTATNAIITLGTAWVYRKRVSGNIVANCHKVPQKEFTKELMAVVEIEHCILSMNEMLKSLNKDLQIIYTVSPVRHLKDGFVENQRSKSHLFCGLHAAISDAVDVHYFPSFEIMNDELRDYRFYAKDMIHPSSVAVDYIWEQFAESWIASDAQTTMNEVAALRRAVNHRPLNPESVQHQNFLKNVNQMKQALLSKHPRLQL